MYLNVHSHRPAQPNSFTIESRFRDFDATSTGPCSLGLHPWYLSETHWPKELQALKTASTHPNVLAIGECGLDKICATDWHLQQEVFVAQVDWALQVNKPLILHCVKALEDTLRLLREKQVSVPVIFHGFRQSKEMATQLLGSGYYISLGAYITRWPATTDWSDLPLTGIFLETDDSDEHMAAIYTAAARLFRKPVDELILTLHQQAEKVFRIKI
ncbi:MAG TPA: TatD family hydrolase [Ferruginibacter sp.]|nr:TatD family hydrolase [Ferruginibacter sp.]